MTPYSISSTTTQEQYEARLELYRYAAKANHEEIAQRLGTEAKVPIKTFCYTSKAGEAREETREQLINTLFKICLTALSNTLQMPEETNQSEPNNYDMNWLYRP